jgi:hypothetical protein
MDDACGKIRLAEMGGHFRGELSPKFLAALRVNAGVTNHGKLVGTRRHKNQDSVVIARFLHAHFNKVGLRRRHRILDRFARDEYPNLPRSHFFRVLDRGDNFFMAQLFYKITRSHKFTNFLPRHPRRNCRHPRKILHRLHHHHLLPSHLHQTSRHRPIRRSQASSRHNRKFGVVPRSG